jgi:hypothetical protein
VRRLISNKTLWPLHVPQGRAEEISAWVAANGIEPDDVSTSHDFIVDDTSSPAILRYTAYLRNAGGRKYCDPATGDEAQEERMVPLVVEPPEHWPVWMLAEDTPRPAGTRALTVEDDPDVTAES